MMQPIDAYPERIEARLGPRSTVGQPRAGRNLNRSPSNPTMLLADWCRHLRFTRQPIGATCSPAGTVSVGSFLPP